MENMSIFRPFINRFERYVDLGLLVILALPLFILQIRNDWIFNPFPSIDPWLYTGYFLRLQQYLNAFPGAYYGTRLPWLLPGHIVYSIFPPLWANYVLHLGFYYIAIFSLYFILKYTLGSRIALLAAIMIGCHFYFLGAIGWDYIDGAGITYSLLTTLMLTCTARFHYWWLFAILAGISYGGLVYTNTILFVFTPSFVLYYWLLNRHYRKNSLMVSSLLFCLGFVAITLLLCTVNYSLTSEAVSNRFWFFLPSFSMALSLGSKPNPWRIDIKTWLPNAYWLLIPTFALLNSLLTLSLSKIKFLKSALAKPVVLIFQVIYLLNALIMLALEIKGDPVLQISYYANYLMPSAFLAIAAQLSLLIEKLRRYQFYLMIFSFLSFCVLAIQSILASRLPSIFEVHPSAFELYYIVPFSILCLAITLLSSCLQQERQRLLVTGLTALVLVTSLYTVFNTKVLLNQQSGVLSTAIVETPNDKSKAAIGPDPEDVFLATIQAHTVLKKIDPLVETFYWYNHQESPVYTSISSASLWGYRLIGQNFPDLRSPFDDAKKTVDAKVIQTRLKPVSKVALLSDEPNAVQQAQQALNKVGFSAKVLSKYDISQANIRFTMTLLNLSETGAASQ